MARVEWAAKLEERAFAQIPALPVWSSRAGRLLAWDYARQALHWGVKHTGLPALVLAALLMIAGYRVARHMGTFMFELAVAVTLLLLATHAGWIRW